MKALGFGIKSLLRDPEWAQKHGINPYNQTAGSVVGDGKAAASNQNNKIDTEDSVKNRAQKGDINFQNDIFSQENLNKLNGINPEQQPLSQRIDGIDKDNTSIFDRMNKFDESHKMLTGANTIQNDPLGVNQPNMDELQRKLGKKLNILM